MKNIHALLRGLFKIVEYSGEQIVWTSTSNPYCAFTKDLSMEGYTPVAFGWAVMGTSSSFVFPSIGVIGGNNVLTMALRMSGASPTNVRQNTLTLRVLYVRTGFIGGGYCIVSLLCAISSFVRRWSHEQENTESAYADCKKSEIFNGTYSNFCNSKRWEYGKCDCAIANEKGNRIGRGFVCRNGICKYGDLVIRSAKQWRERRHNQYKWYDQINHSICELHCSRRIAFISERGCAA